MERTERRVFRTSIRLRIMAAFLLLAILTISEQAPAVSGNELLEICQSQNEADQAFCFGFVQAVKYSVADFPGRAPACKQEIARATGQQLKDIVLKELIDKPAQRHYSAFSISFMAIGKAFGCLGGFSK
jgi:hypothetical protein